MKMRILYCMLPVLFFPLVNAAQTKQEQTGWLAAFNSIKLNKKWGLHFDAQLRTHDNWKGIRNVLLRPGLTYFIQPNQNATIGYLYTPTLPAPDQTNGKTLTEHRIWEQYIISHSLFTGSLSHRLRVEQRFIERPSAPVFAQRLRYFFRDVQPLIKNEAGFQKGPFLAIQNELFFNIQNKAQLNGSFFDQNRAYIAIGFRTSPAFDIEAGYLNQAVKTATGNIMNNVVQLATYTRF